MTCRLCGLDAGEQPYCCAGCENVYAILLESGVLASGQNFRETDLYQQSLKLGLISNRPQAPPSIPDCTETRDAVFHLSGLWCVSCGWLIEHALAGMRGVVSAEVLFASDLLKVRYAPQYLPPERIVERVASLGYRASEYAGRGERSDAERKDLLMRTGIAAFLAMNAMFFSLVVYASYFEKITGDFGRYVPFVLMALATPAVFYCGAPILRIAWAGARQGTLRMESLLAIGILAAYGYSSVQAFAGNLHVYFDTACAIVALVLTGKLIERGAKDRTSRAITLLYRLMPNKARVVVEGAPERFVSAEALKPGTVFRVKAGERIPADGIVIEGRSYADESVLSGESAPRAKQPGDAVVCGSINTGSLLEIRATHAAADSTLAHIVRTVEQAAAHRTRTERAVDRMARVFIPAVLALALATFAGWTWRTGNPAAAMMHAIAVLVIACPCALGIATPLALTAAVAAAGKRGILVADTRVLETIRETGVVVLDKTGTVTAGEFTLLESAGDTTRIAALTAVEACSEHPIGRALGRSALRATDVSVHKGLGISGVVAGVRYFLGNRAFMAASSLSFPAGGLSVKTPEACATGTLVYFGWDQAVHGSLVFGDRIRPEARDLCTALRRRGIRTLLLSGDCEDITRATAVAIGATGWVAEATPDRKIEIVRELQQKGEVVAMIGDGVNDAPSLAQADLGIALGSGADIAMQAAPLVLINQSLGSVIHVLDLARRTLRIVRQNLFWALVYNSIGIALAMAGVLNPIMAAGAMVLSSLSVIGNSRRLMRDERTHGPRLDQSPHVSLVTMPRGSS
ncbi:MAG TPA: cation-translocating P-type ATPase [Bryobacteraceae bacterium]|nr:cation-translocating P-type ATPase [Bryobacteraceae bacterium]